jgi:hypothetical protein
MFMYRVVPAVCIAAAVVLTGCSGSRPSFVAEHEPWRDNEERACLSSGMVRETPFISARSALGGPTDACGALRPFQMTGAAGGRVAMKPAATLRCPMVPRVDQWVADIVEPAARRYLGTPLAEIKVAGSYGCRPMNHQSGGKLSEHGRANALDVSAFILVNGRSVNVKDGWYGREDERAFLRAVHAGTCTLFTTVLGPLADAHHRDHFHMDLARHGRDGNTRICK